MSKPMSIKSRESLSLLLLSCGSIGIFPSFRFGTLSLTWTAKKPVTHQFDDNTQGLQTVGDSYIDISQGISQVDMIMVEATKT